MFFTALILIADIHPMQGVNPDPAFNIGLNFTAADLTNVLYPLLPLPNQNGWVGPEQYILMSYGIIRSFNKTTGQPDGVLNIDSSSFFGTNSEDVRIDYSRYADRWFMTCENLDVPLGIATQLYLEWSDSGVITPSTKWGNHTFSNSDVAPTYPFTRPASFDYNQLATDANAVYISINVFNSVTGAFWSSSVIVIPNSSFISGNEFNYTVLPGVLGPTYPTNLQSAGIAPADNFDPYPEYGYLINAPFDLPGAKEGTLLNFFRILNPGTNATLSPLITIPVPLYATGAARAQNDCPHLGNLYGTNGYLQPTAYNIEAPHVRNKQLYVCQHVSLDSNGLANPTGGRIGVRWYQFDLTGDPTGQGLGVETETTVPALVQWGQLYDPATTNPAFYYTPAIMTNKNGDLVIEGTTSSAVAYTNVFFAARKATDPAGTLGAPVLITNNTTNAFNFSQIGRMQRWGDLSSLSPDPTNDLDIWSTGQWAALQNGYGTQATQLIPSA